LLPFHFTIYLYVTTSLHYLPVCYHFTSFLPLCYHFTSLFTFILALHFTVYLMLPLHFILYLYLPLRVTFYLYITTSLHIYLCVTTSLHLLDSLVPVGVDGFMLLMWTKCVVYFSVNLCICGGHYTKCFLQIQNMWLLCYITSAPRVSIAAAIVRRTS